MRRLFARRSCPASRASSEPREKRCCSPPPASIISTKRFCRRLNAAHGSSATASQISTRAYQGVAGALPAAFIGRLEHVAVGANKPDLTLVLDIPAEAGLERARSRRRKGDADRFEAEGLEFHETLRRAFLQIAAEEPERCVVIDALKSEQEVAEAIWSAVEARLHPESARKASPP